MRWLLLLPFWCVAFPAVSQGIWPNRGQWDPHIRYHFPASGGSLIAEEKGMAVIMHNDTAWQRMVTDFHRREKSFPKNFAFYKVNIIPKNAQPFSWVEGNELPVAPTHFFLGNGPNTRASNVKPIDGIQSAEVWPGVDWLWTFPDAPSYAFRVYPGVHPETIQLQFEGATQLSIRNDSLWVETPLGSFAWPAPKAYAGVSAEATPIPCKFSIDGDVVSFVFPKGYPLTTGIYIDPVLIFSTYSGTTADNFGFTATYDYDGHLYAAGICSKPDKSYMPNGQYPTTAGAFQPAYAGGNAGGWESFPCDVSISKYSPDGTSLLYATYLGGWNNEYPHSIVCDNQNRLIVFGTTSSGNFPTDSLGYDTSWNGGTYDAFCVKFSADGSTLLGGTLLGGSDDDGFDQDNPGGNTQDLKYNYADEFRGEVDIDEDDHILIATCTRSTNIPVSSFAFQKTLSGELDGLIFKLDTALRNVIWSSYLGGPKLDALYSIESTRDGKMVVGGGTQNSGLFTSSNAHQTTYQGGRADGYIFTFTADSLNPVYGTYLGTPAYDQTYFIELDLKGRIYTTGQTEGSWPVSSGVYNQPNSGQFMARLSPDLSTLELSTTFGSGKGDPDLNPSAFLVDYCDHVYFSGWGSDLGMGDHPGSTQGLIVSSNAIQATTDNEDFYLFVLDKDFSSLLYATYYGANGSGNESGDHVDGGTSRFDPRGVVYQSVCSSCPTSSGIHGISNFPTTSGAYCTKNISPRCSNASFKIDFQITSAVIARMSANPTSGCNPLTVNFADMGISPDGRIWDYGDGSAQDTAKNVTHTYTQPGTYRVRLVVIDSNSCNLADTAYKTIEVFGVREGSFTYQTATCSTKATFTSGSGAGNTYRWDLGDSTLPYPTTSTVEHTYKSAGDYRVILYVNEGTRCFDSVVQTVSITADTSGPLAFPNAFTPNNDHINDCFQFSGFAAPCDSVHWWVYSRWGERMFEATRIDDCWNGGFNNFEAATGVYYWVFYGRKKDGTEYHRKGTVQLIRE